MRRAFALLALGAAIAAAPALLRAPAAMPDAVRIPIVREHPQGAPAALFRHSNHTNFMCHSCHPALFPSARVGFTHDDLRAGRYCASCHNGHVAWAIDGAACERCHTAP